MKTGKVPENILKRSILRQIHTKREEVLVGAAVGEDCAAVQLAEDEVFVLSTDPITGTAEDIGSLAIQITLNDLASAVCQSRGSRGCGGRRRRPRSGCTGRAGCR